MLPTKCVLIRVGKLNSRMRQIPSIQFRVCRISRIPICEFCDAVRGNGFVASPARIAVLRNRDSLDRRAPRLLLSSRLRRESRGVAHSEMRRSCGRLGF